MLTITVDLESLDILDDKIDNFVTAFTGNLAVKWITNMPVITGTLRGSTFASLDQLKKREGAPDPTGLNAIARIWLELAGVKPGRRMFLYNSAAYAAFVEYGPHSKPSIGFTRRTVRDAPRIAEQTAALIKAGGDGVMHRGGGGIVPGQGVVE